jgi:hypothetical protein
VREDARKGSVDDMKKEWHVILHDYDSEYKVLHLGQDIGSKPCFWKWHEFDFYNKPQHFRLVGLFEEYNKVMVF